MRTKLITSEEKYHPGYGAGDGYTEHFEYECPCGKGKIIEDHYLIPGDREHFVTMHCDDCDKKYKFDTHIDVRHWELVEINKES